VIDVIDAFSNAQSPIRVTARLPTRQGKKTDEGTMMLPPAPKFNPSAVVVWPETQTLIPATTEKASDIVTNCKIEFCGGIQKVRDFVCPAKYRPLLLLSPRRTRSASAHRFVGSLAHLNVDVFVFTRSPMSFVIG
jgi:hypothetical protein